MKIGTRSQCWGVLGAVGLVLGVQGEARTSGGGADLRRLPCAPAVEDQEGGACLQAGSEPVLGRLYPVSEKLFVSPAGKVVVGGLADLGGARLSVHAQGSFQPENGLSVQGGDASDTDVADGAFGLKSTGGTGFDGGVGVLGYGGVGAGDSIGFYYGVGGTGVRARGGIGDNGGLGAEIFGGEALELNGGNGGTALRAIGAGGYGGGDGAVLQGGDSDEGFGGRGAVATGGLGTFKPGGVGVQAQGGPGCQGGAGVEARGGDAIFGQATPGGTGVIGRGGTSTNGPQGTGVFGEGTPGVHGRSVEGYLGTALYGEGWLTLATRAPGEAGPRADLGFDSEARFQIDLTGSDALRVAVNGQETLVVKAGTPAEVRVHGNLVVEGSLSKYSGTFQIDHPLEPETKTLSHSFVESPDMMNVYNGNVTLGEGGEAWVVLPEWFEALNKDVRYQLTCLGSFAPVFVADGVQGNRFRIAGGTAGQVVSWQVTGVRDDAWAREHRVEVESPKE